MLSLIFQRRHAGNLFFDHPPTTGLVLHATAAARCVPIQL
ncbi:hypothetical protein BIFCAT_01859 [Bifidobacterium catenulatum DSM 16992 = JCM 1194 = LMG 11043]|uniref:Uncharacterized protein n=1 Tax=Bifidobacterium catenulatum DSM 16992 = JCM 1194 = LMG 11043 TaxID=566552 RepID=B6XWZ6_9BIFI|nr:hypothetical protein BIFCAT_01859 [Bifidobacterium catenulatum DSM 16992 = JCM 1194 = LMG 11043]